MRMTTDPVSLACLSHSLGFWHICLLFLFDFLSPLPPGLQQDQSRGQEVCHLFTEMCQAHGNYLGTMQCTREVVPGQAGH